MARKQFNDTVKAAIDDVIEHGFDSAQRVADWIDKLRQAAEAAMTSQAKMEQMLREALAAIYRRQVENAGIIKRHEGVDRFTLQNVKPQLHAELTRRIMASADLIKLNRERAIAETLERFQGWATSIPKGGTDAASKPKIKKTMRKAMASLPFRERRVIIDQSQKFNASLAEIVAKDGGAIAGQWHSHFRQVGYDARPDHAARDGKIYLMRDSWAKRNGLVKPGKAGYADEITAPAEEIFCRCIPGSTKIPFANVSAVYRRWYEGPMLEIATTLGKTLRLTPNHPILSSHGWRAAGAFNVGDYIVEGIRKIVEAKTEKDENDAVPTISQIFEFLAPSSRLCRSRGASNQFHGDGSVNSNVDVISTERPLRISVQSGFVHRVNKFALAEPDLARLSIGAVSKHLDRLWPSAMNHAQHLTARLSHFLGFIVEPYLLGLRGSSQSNAGLCHSTTDGRTSDTMFFGQRFWTGPISVFRNNFLRRKVRFFRTKVEGCFRLIPNNDPYGAQSAPDCRIRDLESLCERHGIDAAKVRFGKIVGIKRDLFSGHVYNLQTVEGWYVANGIISHNCYYSYKYSLRALPADMLTEKGKAALAR
jgi:hypothetical protein